MHVPWGPMIKRPAWQLSVGFVGLWMVFDLRTIARWPLTAHETPQMIWYNFPLLLIKQTSQKGIHSNRSQHPLLAWENVQKVIQNHFRSLFSQMDKPELHGSGQCSGCQAWVTLNVTCSHQVVVGLTVPRRARRLARAKVPSQCRVMAKPVHRCGCKSMQIILRYSTPWANQMAPIIMFLIGIFHLFGESLNQYYQRSSKSKLTRRMQENIYPSQDIFLAYSNSDWAPMPTVTYLILPSLSLKITHITFTPPSYAQHAMST